jgi:hypothetical protein
MPIPELRSQVFVLHTDVEALKEVGQTVEKMFGHEHANTLAKIFGDSAISDIAKEALRHLHASYPRILAFLDERDSRLAGLSLALLGKQFDVHVGDVLDAPGRKKIGVTRAGTWSRPGAVDFSVYAEGFLIRKDGTPSIMEVRQDIEDKSASYRTGRLPLIVTKSSPRAFGELVVLPSTHTAYAEAPLAVSRTDRWYVADRVRVAGCVLGCIYLSRKVEWTAQSSEVAQFIAGIREQLAFIDTEKARLHAAYAEWEAAIALEVTGIQVGDIACFTKPGRVSPAQCKVESIILNTQHRFVMLHSLALDAKGEPTGKATYPTQIDGEPRIVWKKPLSARQEPAVR